MSDREPIRSENPKPKERGDSVILGSFLAIFTTAVVVWVLCCTAYGIPLGGPMGPSAAPQASSGGSSSGPVDMYITIQINPVTQWPQYSPANFSVPLGVVDFTIVNYDIPANFTGCQCNVTGTIGGVEEVNGTTYSLVPSSNVAHTFTVPALGINILNPGLSTITFAVDFATAGTYTWLCMMPCGSNGYTGAPMGVPGYMTGTITVT